MKSRYFPFHWIFLIALVVLVSALPFVDKAFHIDDPFVLTIAGNILQNPLDPFTGNFDWFGSLTPIWQTTTNPPFVSYYLAPFIARFGYSEVALHAAMMLFLIMIAWGTSVLSNRFAGGSLYPLLFVMFSPAVMVSGNVMRDIPAAGLAVAAIAFFVMGTDRENRFYLLSGSVLAGLAILTKYSAIVTIPVMLLYPLFKRKLWVWKWIFPGLAIFLAWCIHNVGFYGQMHVVYLILNKSAESGGIPWTDKACGALVILGSMIYLLPALVWSEARRQRWIAFAGFLPVGLGLFWAIERRFEWDADGQYLLWAITGGLLLYLCLAEGLRRGIRYLRDFGDETAGDSLWLLAWLCAPILFSILFTPFQAVRHQILALPPLMLLGWRAVYRTHKECGFIKFLVAILFLLQAGVGYMAATVDYQFAATYPMMADYAQKNIPHGKDRQIWFVGHWGWKVYAEKAGFQMRHANEALPKPGDIVLWPLRVHSGNVWHDLKNENAFQILDHVTVGKVVYQTPIPMRLQNFHGASFYAVMGDNIPYRFFQDIDLETLKAYRVKEYDRQNVLKTLLSN